MNFQDIEIRLRHPEHFGRQQSLTPRRAEAERQRRRIHAFGRTGVPSTTVARRFAQALRAALRLTPRAR